MHTFVVRVFVASDLDGFVGVVEEPLTGLRRPFDGPDDLMACLVLAARRPAGARPGDVGTERDAADEGVEQSGGSDASGPSHGDVFSGPRSGGRGARRGG
jgi:hypothetical protein